MTGACEHESPCGEKACCACIAAALAQAANDALEMAAVIADTWWLNDRTRLTERIRALKTASGAEGQPPAAQTKSDPPKKAFDPNDVDFGDTE